jgi:hypothetical protein
MKIPTYLGRVPALMGNTAGGSVTADQWLIAATAVCPVAVGCIFESTSVGINSSQVPQIWDEYSPGEDPEALRLRRRQDFAALLECKKAAQAKARAERQVRGNAPVEADTRRSKRPLKRSARDH